jgi:NAD(P) transhydrogenase subunit alpha
LGAIIRSFDTRAAVREQIESMGGEFLEVTLKEDGDGGGGYAKEMSPAFLEAEYALFRKQAKEIDIVITTALIPNKPAPKLWFKDMVELMKPGSVIVDMAAESGGNCDVTVANEVVVHNGVIVLGFTDLAGRLPTTASNLYGQNLVHLLTDMGGAKGWKVDFEDEVVRGATVTHQGDITWPPPVKPAAAPAPAAPKPAAVAAPAPVAAPAMPAPTKSKGHGHGGGGPKVHLGSARSAPLTWLSVGALALAYFLLQQAAPDATGLHLFAQQLTIFALSCFVGWQVVWNVAPALHTPLMSVTNAISGIIVVGGMLHLSGDLSRPAALLALAAVLFATINIGGGFMVTRRMLKMFHR